MAILDKSKRLRKNLSLIDVYAISLGATLSSGFFLLPGLAAAEAGPAVILTYVIALLPLIPGILSKVELSTAMPRAGGEYYFLDRSIGPALGTIGGIGTWLALVLKVSFALVGMGAYISLYWPGAPMKVLAVVLAVAFGVLNLVGAKKSGGIQTLFVGALLLLLLWFVSLGTPHLERVHFDGFFDRGSRAILSTAGLVCVSYIGLTKVASVSEEVKDPERSLPRAMFLSLITASVVYILGTTVMVGVLTPDELYGDLTPVATTAEAVVGRWGGIVMTVAAVLAFFSVANAGILSASRYPLAMSRDSLMPSLFSNLGRSGMPTNAIVVTVLLIVASVLFLDPLKIAKLAAAFQLMLFACNCLAVLVMRASKIESYDPGYRSICYPWMQIVGFIAPFVLIGEMGWLAVTFTGGLVVVGLLWYFVYAHRRVDRHGAINQVFGRLARQRFEDLDRELRSILKEKGLRRQDPFDEVVARAFMLDLHYEKDFETIARKASEMLAERLPCDAETLVTGFLEGTQTGATPVAGGVALPHLRVPGIDEPELALVRCRSGIELTTGGLAGGSAISTTIYAIFFLVSSDSDPGQHLRLLAEFATRVDQDGFLDGWRAAPNVDRLKESVLRHDRWVDLPLSADTPAASLIDRRICDVDLPPGCLIAVIKRGPETIIPDGTTALREGDQLTVIGETDAIRGLYDTYLGGEGGSVE